MYNVHPLFAPTFCAHYTQDYYTIIVPMDVITTSMCGTHPNFSLKNLGKKSAYYVQQNVVLFVPM